MTRGHPNAPLTPAGRRRLCERVDQGRPIAHVAAEAGISRRCLAKWYARWQADGEAGLADRSSTPTTSPDRTAPVVEDLVEQLRRETKSATRTCIPRSMITRGWPTRNAWRTRRAPRPLISGCVVLPRIPETPDLPRPGVPGAVAVNHPGRQVRAYHGFCDAVGPCP